MEIEVPEYSETLTGEYKFDDFIPENSQITVNNRIDDHTFSLVIPAYNEEKRIEPFLRHLSKEIADNWEIILVCDGNDRTADIARAIDDRFKILEFKSKLGKGKAIIEGFKLSDGNIVGYVDADGSLSFNEISKVFSSLSEGYEVAVGSRWVKGSTIGVKQTIVRILLGRIYHYMSFALLGLKVKDTQCGLKAFSKSLIKELVPAVTLKNLSFDTALLYHCMKLDAKIIEIPVHWNDVGGSKVHPLKTSLIMFFSLVGIRLAHSKSSKKFNGLFNSLRDLLENA